MRRIPPIVAALAMLATALRLPTLANAGIWRDEANVYVELGASSFGGFLHRVAAIDYHPPLYFVLEYFWSRIAGVGEIAFQLLPLAFSIATVPVVYLLGKAAGSRAVGLLAAALFAIAPLAITYSTDYLYPVAIFTNALLALQVTVARKAEPSANTYVLTAAAALLAVYSHYTALIFIPLLIVWALSSPRGFRHGARVAGATIAGTLPFLFWLPVFLHQHQVGLPYDASPHAREIGVFIASALALLTPVPPLPLAIVIFAAVLAVPMLVALRDSFTSDCAALGFVSLGTIVLVSAAGLHQIRYVLPFCTLLYVFAAWAFVAFAERLRRDDAIAYERWGRPFAAVLALVLLAANTAYAAADGGIPHSGIRTFLASMPVEQNTLYLVAPDYMAPDLAYYSRGTNVGLAGFARFEHPEYYVLDGYADLWNDPLLLRKTLAAIAQERDRYRYLDVIVDSWTHDAHRIPFGKARLLIAELQRRYLLTSRVSYDGRWEPVSVYRFDLTAAPNAGAVNDDWTQFRLNGRHDATLPGNLRTTWRVETGGDFSSSPTIVGTRLYAGNNAGNLYAMDVRTGRVLWQRHVASPLMSNPLFFDGVIIAGQGDSVPRLGNFFHPYDIGTGKSALLAFDAATGATRWTTPLAGTAMATPAIVDGLLIDHYGAGQVLALDPRSGKVLYAKDGSGDGAMSSVLPGDEGTFFTTGMWAPSQFLTMFTGAIHSPVQKRRARDGSLIWSTDLPDDASATGDCPAASDGRVVFCDYIMAVAGGTIHVGTRVYEVAYAIDATTGNFAWRTSLERGVRPPKNVAAIPLAFGGKFYLGSSIAPYVHALDARDGRLQWRVKVRGPVKGGIARQADAIYFGDLAGYLWAVNAKTGRVIGSKNMHTKFNVGSPVIDGQTLVIGSSSGSLIAIPLDVIRASRDG